MAVGWPSDSIFIIARETGLVILAKVLFAGPVKGIHLRGKRADKAIQQAGSSKKAQEEGTRTRGHDIVVVIHCQAWRRAGKK